MDNGTEAVSKRLQCVVDTYVEAQAKSNSVISVRHLHRSIGLHVSACHTTVAMLEDAVLRAAGVHGLAVCFDNNDRLSGGSG